MSTNLVHTALYSLTVAFFVLSSSCTTPIDHTGPPAGSEQFPGEVPEEKPGATPDARRGDTQETTEKVPREKAERAGLPTGEIFRLSRRAIPDRFLFIEERGMPVSLFYDLDGNGYRDALYVLVERSSSLADSEAVLEFGTEEGGKTPAAPSDNGRTDAAENDSGENTGSRGSMDSGDGAASEGAAGTESAETPAGSGDSSGGPGEQEPSEEELREEKRQELLERWYRRGRVPKEALSSVSRIYADRIEPVNYYLSVFLQAPDELISMYRIPLGAWKVFEGFGSVEIVEGQEMPYCVSSSFQTADGKERVWVIFSKYNKFSTLTLTDTVSEHTELRDIDGDGILDVIEWSQIFEEGTGYETFLTWFKWNGTKFVQHRSANVVRSLNEFLSTAGRLLQAGAWNEAFSHMMSPRDYDRFLGKGYDHSQLFSLLFDTGDEQREGAGERGTGDEDGSADPETAVTPEEILAVNGNDRAFHMVVFPRVMENPFRRYVESDEGPPYRVRLAVRFSVGKSRRFVRYCEVQMHENPFSRPQFFLVPEE